MRRSATSFRLHPEDPLKPRPRPFRARHRKRRAEPGHTPNPTFRAAVRREAIALWGTKSAEPRATPMPAHAKQVRTTYAAHGMILVTSGRGKNQRVGTLQELLGARR